MHNIFVKSYLVSKHCRPGSPPLIIVQIDFEKAFDKVPREALWLRLEERGVCGEMLSVLKKAYERVVMRIKVNGERSEPFNSLQGVKQGCPLSTELFGLFIETLAEFIDKRDESEANFPHEAPSIGGRRVSNLLYADDLSLLAMSPRRLTELLWAVDNFCEAFGMRANVKKCECLIFACSAELASTTKQECESLRLAGERIPIVDKAKYLGLMYGPQHPFKACREGLVDVARAVMFNLAGGLRRARIWTPDVMLNCFNTKVRPILTYGCELWGVHSLSEMFDGGPPPRRRDSSNLAEGPFEACLKDSSVKLQISFMRSVAGASKPAHRLLFAELSQLPLHYYILKQVIGWWNRLAKQPESLAYCALQESVKEALQGDSVGWAAALLRVLGKLKLNASDCLVDGSDSPAGGALPAIRPLPIAQLCSELRNLLMSGWEHCRLVVPPEQYPSDGRQPGIQMSKYKHWMGLPFSKSAAAMWLPHATSFIPFSDHRKLMRFRLCCWPLAANRSWGGVPREQRICRLCNSSSVEDEHHILLDCPAYDSCRAESAVRFEGGMHEVMTKADPAALAALLARIWDMRSTRVPFGR
jgi:Reverse transcriptase (RNA-dependent DNA polymerase)